MRVLRPQGRPEGIRRSHHSPLMPLFRYFEWLDSPPAPGDAVAGDHGALDLAAVMLARGVEAHRQMVRWQHL